MYLLNCTNVLTDLIILSSSKMNILPWAMINNKYQNNLYILNCEIQFVKVCKLP